MPSWRAASSTQRDEAAFGLGVALEPFGRPPLLRRDRVVRRALHALAAFDEGRDHQPVDLRQPGRMQQRIDRFLDRDRARPLRQGHRLALPARPRHRGVERRAAQDRALALAFAGLDRRALVDQQAVALRLDQRDAELVAPQRERIAVDAMDPRAAEIERRAQRVVGPGAAAEARARLEHGDPEARIVQQPRGDEPRHAGAHDDHVLGLARAHRPGAGGGHSRTSSGNCFMSLNRKPPAAPNASRLA